MNRATNSRQNRRARKKKPTINFTDLEDDESKTVLHSHTLCPLISILRKQNQCHQHHNDLL